MNSGISRVWQSTCTLHRCGHSKNEQQKNVIDNKHFPPQT